MDELAQLKQFNNTPIYSFFFYSFLTWLSLAELRCYPLCQDTISTVPEGSAVKTGSEHSRQAFQVSEFVDDEIWQNLTEVQHRIKNA